MTKTEAQPLVDHIAELVNKHGSFRKASKAVGVNSAYLYRMSTGESDHPPAHTLAKLGLLSTPLYCRIKP